MKKALLMFVVPMLASLSVHAQKLVETKEITFTQGANFFSFTASFIDNPIILGDNFKYTTPTYKLRGERSIKEFPFGLSLGLGAVAGYAKGIESYISNDQIGWDSEASKGIFGDVRHERNLTRLFAGPQVSVHYSVATRFDVYARGQFAIDFGGIFNMSQELSRKRHKSLEFDYGMALGAEYFVTDRIGIIAEAGVLSSQWVSAGIVISFGENIVSDFFYRTPKYM